MLRVRLLGQFDVRLDDKPIELSPRSAQSLIAYLILNRGNSYRREKLAGMLWPASTEANARNNLRQALWRIRRSLDPKSSEYLQADNFAIGFNENSSFWLDASILEAPLKDDWLLEDLMETAGVYQGDLLPGFYENWVVLEREHLRAQYEQKILVLLDRLIRETRWNDVLVWAEKWIANGGSPEPAYRALMIAHSKLGDIANVASSYQRCKDALDDALGLEPSEETEQLFRSLTQGEPVSKLSIVAEGEFYSIPTYEPEIEAVVQPAVSEKVSAPSAADVPVFVAREHEISRLNSYLDEVLSGKGKVVFIAGEPGSGKTALMFEFARQAEEKHKELVVVSGRCDSFTGIGDPYLPFRESLSAFYGGAEGTLTRSGIVGRQKERLRDLAPLAVQTIVDQGSDLINSIIPGPTILKSAHAHFPNRQDWLANLKKIIGQSSILQRQADIKPKNLFQQCSVVLQCLSERNPIILLLDDLQWADTESISLLFHLGRRIGESRILILGAYRPDELPSYSESDDRHLRRMLSEFKRELGDIVIDLGQITEPETLRFVDQLLDTEPNRFGDVFRKELHRHTSGNPLFTIELLRALEERGDIVHDKERRWMNGPTLNWRKLPARIESVVEERISRLNEDLRELLTVASVEGETFTAEVVSRVLERDDLGVVRDLSSGLDKTHRLVHAYGVERIGDQRLSLYQFRHILFQKHLYNHLDSVERAYLHEAIGLALEAIYADQVEDIATQLAHQFKNAGIVEKAVDYLHSAALKSKRVSAHGEAISHLNTALSLLDSSPDVGDIARRELELRIPLGISLIATQGYGSFLVEQNYSRARELSLEIGDQRRIFHVLFGLRTFHLVRGEHQVSRELGEQLLGLARTIKDEELLLEAHQALGTTMFYQGELKDAKRHLEKGMELYDLDRHHSHAYRFGQDPGITCLSYLSLISMSMGYAEKAVLISEQALSLAEKVAHPFSMALAMSFAALLYRLTKEWGQAKTKVELARALSADHGFPFWEVMATTLEGSIVAERDPQKGIEMIRTGMESWDAMGLKLGLPLYSALLAEALVRGGDTGGAVEVVDEALDFGKTFGDRLVEANLYRIRGEIALANNHDVGEIENAYRSALAVSRVQHNLSFELQAAMRLAQLWIGEGRLREGRRLVKRVFNKFTEGFQTVDLISAKKLLAEI
jgi:predicted ATPase/DNA-binding SARP family transcriptional activator